MKRYMDGEGGNNEEEPGRKFKKSSLAKKSKTETPKNTVDSLSDTASPAYPSISSILSEEETSDLCVSPKKDISLSTKWLNPPPDYSCGSDSSPKGSRSISIDESFINPTCHMGKNSEMTPISSTSETSSVQPSKDGRKLVLLMRTAQCVQFKSLIECLKELLSEVNIDFIEGKGMRLVSIDPGRIGLLHLEVNNIEYFYAKGIVTAGLSMLHLYRMIRSMTSGDFMEWRIYEDDIHRMEIELSNSERRTKTVNSIKLLDLDEVDYVIPQVEFDRVVSMPSSELSKHVREMATVSPYITIRGTRTTLEILAEGDMSSSHVIIEPTASGLNWRHSEDGDDIEGKYFAKYIEKFTKNSLANNVELFLKNNYPLIMRFEISIGCLRCCIAPIQEKV